MAISWMPRTSPTFQSRFGLSGCVLWQSTQAAPITTGAIRRTWSLKIDDDTLVSCCGLSRTGLPLKRKFQPRCCAKTRAGAPCIMRVVPGKRRCRFHGGLSTGPKTKAGRARIAEVQRRRYAVLRGFLRFRVTPHDARTRVLVAIAQCVLMPYRTVSICSCMASLGF